MFYMGMPQKESGIYQTERNLSRVKGKIMVRGTEEEKTRVPRGRR